MEAANDFMAMKGEEFNDRQKKWMSRKLIDSVMRRKL